ncbi:MAG: spondin domain-containing protein [Anaerolineae bacterium]|jgi:hypothetical protein
MKKVSAAILFVLLLSSCVCPSPPEPTAVPTATSEPTTAPRATMASTEIVPLPTRAPSPVSPLSPQPTPSPVGSAQYRLTFEATWSAATHPTDFPPNPHFSGLIGAAHRPDVRLWQVGELASPGIKNMAETGAKSPLDSEIDALIAAGGGCVQISGGGVNPSPGVVAVTFEVSEDCPAVSVVTMIAPSPDWFLGVSALSLLEDGVWVDEKVVELFPYDAGTDSGVSYTSPDLPTASPEGIFMIEGEPLLVGDSVLPLGTFTFTRLEG